MPQDLTNHNDVIKWKYFPHYWPFVRGILWSPVNSPHKSQWRGTLIFSFICAWIIGWVHTRDAGDLRRHRSHYGVNVMWEINIDTDFVTPANKPLSGAILTIYVVIWRQQATRWANGSLQSAFVCLFNFALFCCVMFCIPFGLLLYLCQNTSIFFNASRSNRLSIWLQQFIFFIRNMYVRCHIWFHVS